MKSAHPRILKASLEADVDDVGDLGDSSLAEAMLNAAPRCGEDA